MQNQGGGPLSREPLGRRARPYANGLARQTPATRAGWGQSPGNEFRRRETAAAPPELDVEH